MKQPKITKARKALVAAALLLGMTGWSATGSTARAQTHASPDSTLTLSQAIQVALANNHQIKRSLLSLEDADEQVRMAWSEVLPDISGSASYSRNIELPVFFFPQDPSDPNSPLRAIQAGEDNNWNAGLSVEQTLFRGEAFVGIGTSQLYKEAQAEGVRATTQQIVTDTRLAYYDVLIAEERLRLQHETVSRLRENLRENRARREAGLVDSYQVLQVEVQLGNQEPQLTQARYEVRQAYRRLKMVLGVPLDLSLSVTGDLGSYTIRSDQAGTAENRHLKEVDTITPYRYQGGGMEREAVTDMRGDIRVLETQNDLKGKEIRAIKSRFLPSLTARYNLGWRAEEPGSPTFFGKDRNRVRTQSLMLSLSVPIFEGFGRMASLNMARIEKRDLEIQREQVIRQATSEIQSARESLDQAIETAPARRKALDQAREGYQRATARLENGLGSQLDVIEAEFQLRQAEVNYASMVYRYLTAKARYDLALGMVPYVDSEAPERE
ncbi:MAG: TolC family protein [Balneolaceae bacterium]|nr:TolC family protein [Balneolaceae bacterium]